jgi:hypothetical protein
MAHVISPLDAEISARTAVRQSDWIDAQTPAPAGAAITITAPVAAAMVLFAANGAFYARITAPPGPAVTATVPAGAVTDGSGSELNPQMRRLVRGGSFISIISPTGGASVVTLQYFAA